MTENQYYNADYQETDTDTDTEKELDTFHTILQNVLLNWGKISTDPDYAHILDPERNSMYEKFRDMDENETDKMIKAKCMAFLMYVIVVIS